MSKRKSVSDSGEIEVTAHDVICKCGHSIDYHSTHGCFAFSGEKLDKKCSCRLTPHHIAKELLANAQRWI